MGNYLSTIKTELETYRQQVLKHPVYSEINKLEDLQIFMQHHIFAVWDFMSLLKSLQNNLTCTALPWVPVGSPETRYFINEIVNGEESDVNQHGIRMSHFELYLEAMKESGANTEIIDAFIQDIKQVKPVSKCLDNAHVAETIKDFVNYTFDVIEKAPIHVQAAVFTFGREDLIPDMFHSMIAELHQSHPEKIETFHYYLERHIEVDGDHHSQLAINMLNELCGNDEKKWQEVKDAAMLSLQKRAALWDGVYKEIRETVNS